MQNKVLIIALSQQREYAANVHSNKQLVNGYYAFPNLRCSTLVYIFLTLQISQKDQHY